MNLPVDVVNAGSERIAFLSDLSSKVPVVGLTWMLSSAVLTTYTTTKFLSFSSSSPIASTERKQKVSTSAGKVSLPVALTFYRFTGSLLLGCLLHPRPWEDIPLVNNFVAPGIWLFIANVSNSISLNRIGISLTYTSKCAIPLITVVLTTILDGWGALPNRRAMCSLLPIAFGIAMASWDAPTFEAIGFLAAAVSAASQSALNISSKRAMVKTGVSGPRAQRAMVVVGLCLTVVLNLVRNFRWQTLTHPLDEESRRRSSKDDSQHPPLLLSAAAAVAYHIEYTLSFTFVSLVTSVTYGAADAVRRLMIILTGRSIFGGPPLKTLNKVGIAVALSGALAYALTK